MVMAPSEIEPEKVESPSAIISRRSEDPFARLRGVRWRINLGILPSYFSSTIDDLRRVTADSRRRYAALRRRLLVDPHLSKDGSNSPDLSIDNPLSQNPDSSWGRFFRNAELEKTVDQDLSRLYPEHGTYFQAPGCQGMLRRILLLWCLRHPEVGYRQGMHELLAPLLYVLHVDMKHLSEVRKNYENHFTDRFDDLSFQESDVTYSFDFKKFLGNEDEVDSQGATKKVANLEELDPEIQTVVRLSDAYGSEGELGIVLSEKFMEHDCYCMFDALMSGAYGAVAMADFFAHNPAVASHSGLPPVIEASAATYRLLSAVDSSLHSHLVEIGVEPQYFALRWFRVLFGREFSLDDLLLVWDEIFFADNGRLDKGADSELGSSCRILSSQRGALISAMAVSMILSLRSSLLATEHATSCLQRLLNFPENADLGKIIAKAKTLQSLALDINISSPPYIDGVHDKNKSPVTRVHSLPSESVSPKSPLVVPESYWEEKWRVLHKAEELRQNSLGTQSPIRRKGWAEKVKLKLSRTESDPLHRSAVKGKKEIKPPVRRSLLEDLSRQLGFEGKEENLDNLGASNQNGKQVAAEVPVIKNSLDVEEDKERKSFPCTSEESLNGDSSGNSPIFSDDQTNPLNGADCDENDSESSVASNLLPEDNNDIQDPNVVDSPLPVSHPPVDESPERQQKYDAAEKSLAALKEKKFLSGKFQWFWKFGRNGSGEETSNKRGNCGGEETSIKKGSDTGSAGSADADGGKEETPCPSATPTLPCHAPSSGKGETDQNVMGTLKNLGHSMLEHIQVIESVFQQERGLTNSVENTKNGFVEKGQVTALTALKELRKISNLLSEM